jgi:Reverse transcriptase (RNA-dependent DNA polymerase)
MVRSNAEYGAGILFVKKKTGELRMCVDYRNLNEGTVKETYPLQLIQEITKLLEGERVFTTLDLKDAFNQIRIAKEDIKKTTFRTKYGNFA